MTEEIKKKGNHYWWLLFWPIFGVRYLILEQLLVRSHYHPVYSILDDWVPFREGFLIPYVLWYFLFVGMHLYTCFTDIPAFQAYSRYLTVSISISTLIFLIYPTYQNLRPDVIPRDNFVITGVRLLYRVDTNTNVCPSEHVIGAVGAFLAARQTKSMHNSGTTLLFAVVSILSAISTVFLKQHSVIDVLAAFPVCAIAWYFSFRKSPSD